MAAIRLAQAAHHRTAAPGGFKAHKEIMYAYPYELTEGKCQKVMIAIAMANQPRLLIADEPTNAIEPTTLAQIFRLLACLNQNNGTINFIYKL